MLVRTHKILSRKHPLAAFMGGHTAGRAGVSSRRARSDDELLGLDEHDNQANSSDVREAARCNRRKDSNGKRGGFGSARNYEEVEQGERDRGEGSTRVVVDKRGREERAVHEEVYQADVNDDVRRCDDSSVDSFVERNQHGRGITKSGRITEVRVQQGKGGNDAGQIRLKGTVSVAGDADLHNVSSVSGASSQERHESMLIANTIPTVFKATNFFGSAADIGHDSKIAEFFFKKLCIEDPDAKRVWWARRQNDVRKN